MKIRMICSQIVAVSMLVGLMVGCGKKAEDAVPMLPEHNVSFDSVSAEELVNNRNLFHARIRATNPGYTGGALVAYDEQAGLVGQINLKSVANLEGLRGMPFGAIDLRGCPVSDLSPLKDMPIVMLGLEQTGVTDLAPLKGMKIKKLYLSKTGVKDISSLAGMPLEELMLIDTQVSDLSPLKDAPIKMLWLNNTAVSNITPVAACPLLSLTLEGTPVSDIAALKGHQTLERLHIGGTKVSDLSPIKGLKLTRLIFTPSSITKGIDAASEMKTLRELGTTLKDRMAPAVFWGRYGDKM
jgi:internalin A